MMTAEVFGDQWILLYNVCINLHEALHGLDDVRGTKDAALAVVRDNPLRVDGALVPDEDAAVGIEFEAGHDVASLDRTIRGALEQAYGESLSPRDRELVVSGVRLAAMSIQRWTVLDGGPRFSDPEQ
jgi:hypothetical protein